jgi:uncharacterized membrane protein
LAAAAVVFFIVMTAWGFFESASLRILLGTSLSLGILMMTFPFTDRGSSQRRVVLTLTMVIALLLLITIFDYAGNIGIWERLV